MQKKGWNAFLFGSQPNGKGTYDQYFSLKRPVRLKDECKWGEVKHLQNIVRKAAIWEGFPARHLRFVTAEISPGDEAQRIDLLYIRNDGGVYPCELKLGGSSPDTHGQLMRYTSDLSFQNIDRMWLEEKHSQYLARIHKKDKQTQQFELQKFKDYLTDNNLEDRHIRLIPRSGIIIDEDFTPAMLKAVRYMNEQCGCCIRLIQVSAFVAEGWKLRSSKFHLRLDFTEVQ